MEKCRSEPPIFRGTLFTLWLRTIDSPFLIRRSRLLPEVIHRNMGFVTVISNGSGIEILALSAFRSMSAEMGSSEG